MLKHFRNKKYYSAKGLIAFYIFTRKELNLKRYIIELAYSGKNFQGWQIQPNAKTVQEVIENAVSTILGKKISLTGAGRTDSGVHASYFVSHFDTDIGFNSDKLCFKLNSFLSKDICIFSVKETHKEFHARFNATSRTYKYILSTQKKVFLSDLAMSYHGELDFHEMKKASDILLRTKDFTSFAKLHSDNKTNICNIEKADWRSYKDYIIFTITADRFLRNMVRSITATLLDIGKSKIKLSDLERIIELKDNQNTPMSAPAHGLYLFDIEYPLLYKLNNPIKDRDLPFI